MKIGQIQRIVVPQRSDFECFKNTVSSQSKVSIRDIHGAIIPIGREAQNLISYVDTSSFVALEARRSDGTFDYFKKCFRSRIGAFNGLRFIEFEASAVDTDNLLKACVYLSKGYKEIGPIFSTSYLDFESLERHPGHPYFTALRMLSGEVTEANCYWLNSHLVARGDRTIHLAEQGMAFDYLFRLGQTTENIFKRCWAPVVEFGLNSAKQCGGVVISPFGDILTVTHATMNIKGKDIVNFVRKDERITRLGHINRVFYSARDDLDLSIIRVPINLLRKIFGTQEVPFACFNPDSVGEGNIFMWGFPHLGYPHEPTEQLLSTGRIGSIVDDKKFYAQMLGLHGHSGSPVFNSSGEVIGILVGGYSARESSEDGTYYRFRPYFSILDEVSSVKRLSPIKDVLLGLGSK